MLCEIILVSYSGKKFLKTQVRIMENKIFFSVVGVLLHLLSLLRMFNPLNPELNPICYLLALLGAHHFLHVSRIKVKSLTLRQLMLYIYIYIYIYGAPILDVSRSHTTTRTTVGRTPLDE